jgi:hypothetical protein
MTQNISRLYSSSAQASRALADLKDNNYRDVFLVNSESAGASHDAIVTALMKAYVWKPNAVILAKGIAKGGSLVTVHAPFGTGRDAMDLMDAHGPIDSGVPDHNFPSVAWNERTPVSSALQMPVLMKTKLPFSTIWNVPAVLRRPVNISELFGMPMLSKSAAPLSKMIGMSVLSDKTTPLSSRFGLPLLSKGRTMLG